MNDIERLFLGEEDGSVSAEPLPDDAGYLENATYQQLPPTDDESVFKAGQAAAIRGKPTDPSEISKALYESSISDPRDYAEAEYYQKATADLSQYVQGALQSTTIPPEVIAYKITKTNELLNRRAQPGSKERAYMDGVAPNADEEKKLQSAFYLMAANDIQSMTQGTSFASKAADFAGFLIPGGYAKDVYDVPDAVRKYPELASIADSDLQNVIFNFHALPAQEKAAIWPSLKQAVMDATSTFGITDGNALKAATILTQMLEPDANYNVGYNAKASAVFDAAATVPVGKVAAGIKALATGGLSNVAKVTMRDAVTAVKQNANAVSLAANAGDVESAALLNSAALKDAQVAAGLNVSRDVAAVNSLPVNTAEWFKNITPGLAPEMAARIQDDLIKAEGFVRSITGEKDLLHIGALSKSDRTYQTQTFLDKLTRFNKSDYAQEGYNLSDVRIVGEDGDGFTFQYTLSKNTPIDTRGTTLREMFDNSEIRIGNAADTAPAAPETLSGINPQLPYGLKEGTHTGTVRWSIDAVTGNYGETAKSLEKYNGSTMGLSTPTWSVGGSDLDFGKAVTDMGRVVDIEAGVRNQLNKVITWAVEPIKGLKNTGSRARVDAVLMHGDEFVNEGTAIRGRTFTKQELAAGFDIGGKHVSLTRPEEVQAYYRMRMAADIAHAVQNKILRRELQLGGFKSTRFSLKSELIGRDAGEVLDYEVVAKPYETATAASQSAAKRPGYRALDVSTGRNEVLTSEEIARQYDNGKLLVRTKSDFSPHGDFAVGKEHVEYLFVPRESIAELPTQVLHYKPGYVPKINDAQWAVKASLPIVKAGVTNARKTVATRLFNSLDHAEKFRMQLATDFAKKNGVTLDEALARFPTVKVDSMSPMERLEDAVGAHGGLYTGTRSADDLLFGFAGTQPERLSALDSFKRYLNHLSTQYPRNELRLRMEKEWLNTVRAKLPDTRITGFSSTAMPDTAMGRALETMRRQIKEWNSIPSQQETWFQAGIQYGHDWVLNKWNAGATRLGFQTSESIKPLLWLKNADPIQAAKSAATHLLLGSLNVAQIPVQASAAMIAISRRWGTPLTLNTGSDILHAFRFATLDNIRNETALGKVLNKLIKSGEIDERVAEAYKAWTRTGLYDASLNSLEAGVLTTDGMGVVMDTLRKVGDVNMTFYKAGDLFARRLSFIKEYAYWTAKHPGKVVDDDALLAITKEVDKDLLQLNSASRAVWQGGKGTGMARELAGMATQYMQVTTRMVELMVKPTSRGGFTNKEVFKILSWQALLFGAAGVPLFNMFGPNLIKHFGLTNISEQEATMINQGAVGALFSSVLGMHADISQRIAVGSQMTEFVRDLMTSDDPLMLRALGPFGSATGSRVLDAMRELDILFSGSREGEQELDRGTLMMALNTLGQIPSGSRNALKAWMMHQNHELIDRHGNVIMRRNFDWQEELAQALGFRLTEETASRFINMDKRTIQEDVTELADARVRLMYNAIFVHKLDEKQMGNIRAAIQLMDESLPPMIRDEVKKRVDRKLWEAPETMQDQAIKQFLETTVPEKLGSDAIYDSQGVEGMTNPVVSFSSLLRQEDEK